MSINKTDLTEDLRKNLNRGYFAQRIPSRYEPKALFDRVLERFPEDEAPEVLAELSLTIENERDRDDYHLWNYDHLEFIIEESKVRGFPIPRNLLNGLPEQLILLVDSKKIE